MSFSTMPDANTTVSENCIEDSLSLDTQSGIPSCVDGTMIDDVEDNNHHKFAKFANNTSGNYVVTMEVKGYEDGGKAKSYQIASITFQGVKLYVVRLKKGEYMIPIKPVVYGMDLTVTGQVLRTKKYMPEDINILSLPQICGGPTAVCLPIHSISKWLSGIHLNRVSVKSRPLVAAFQKECEDILYYTIHTVGEYLKRTEGQFVEGKTIDGSGDSRTVIKIGKCLNNAEKRLREAETTDGTVILSSNNLPDNVLSENEVTRILEECPVVEDHVQYTPDDVTNEIKSLLAIAVTKPTDGVISPDNTVSPSISENTVSMLLNMMEQMQQDHREFRDLVTAKLDLLSVAISQVAAPLRYSVQTFADVFNVKLGIKELSKIEWDCEFMSNHKNIPISSIIESKNGLVSTYDLSILSDVFSQVYPRIKFK